MFSVTRFFFFAFVVCCTCKNQVGLSGSYFVTGDKQADGPYYCSAFTVTVDDAYELFAPLHFFINDFYDFAAYRVAGSDERYVVIATTDQYGNNICMMPNQFQRIPGEFHDDSQTKLHFNDVAIDFYSYKDNIRTDFTLTYRENDKEFTSTAKGEKVSQSELKNHIDFTTVVPRYARYTEFYKVTYEEPEGGKVGVLTNKEDGVIDVVWERDNHGIQYSGCVWENEDEITCNGLRIAFSGAAGSVVSCLVFFISVFGFSLL